MNTKFAEKNSVFRRLKVFVSVSKKDTQTLSLFVRSVKRYRCRENFPILKPLHREDRLVASGVVRRSRLYYLRNLFGKAARITSRRLLSGTQMTTEAMA